MTRRLPALALPCLAALALAGCVYDRTPNFLAAPLAAKIPADYRVKIVAWARRYYAEPASVRILAISDPAPVRTGAGQEVWLVCAEIDAHARGGGPMGARRIAFGFGAGPLSAPNERSGIDLRNEDCELRPLAWRAWSEPRRAARRG